eukprot:jgi/Psemu1/312388/fgenesh1_kg.940_\
MKQRSIFVGSALCLLQLLATASSMEEEVKMECLPTTTEFDSFHCVSSKESLRVTCSDGDERCEDWARQGECQSNPQYMLVDCRKSCKSCISLHPGDEPQVAYPKTRSDAKDNVENLKRCTNKHSECTHWWAVGECDKNPQFMKTECSAACQTCK